MTPLLAHAGHGAAPNYPLLIGAGVALVAGVIVGTSKRAKPWMSWSALGAALVLGGLALAIQPAHPDGGEAQVRFVDPLPDETVPAREPLTLTAAVDGAPVATSPTDTEGGHVHFYVDGELQPTGFSTQTTVELSPGSHELQVEYVDAMHVSFDPKVEQTITVTAR